MDRPVLTGTGLACDDSGWEREREREREKFINNE
jgi:hypothetical protein